MVPAHKSECLVKVKPVTLKQSSRDAPRDIHESNTSERLCLAKQWTNCDQRTWEQLALLMTEVL